VSIVSVWLTSQKRKVHQRAINKLIREMNKRIEDDDLWLGRFYTKQIKSDWQLYEDGSGADLYVRLRFIDRKTGVHYDTGWECVNSLRFGAKLYWKMNWFIVEYCDVWGKEDPRKDTRVDYRK
jgi:hypothetical protein